MNMMNNRKYERMTLLCLVAATLWTYSFAVHAREPQGAAPALSARSHAPVGDRTPAPNKVGQGAKSRKAAPAVPETHLVQNGEFLGGIAQQYGVTTADLMQANDIDNPDRIQAGTVLQIPGRDSGETPARARAKKSPGVVISIPDGLTLTRIAKLYGVSVRAIVKANASLQNPDRIRSGQRILIPGVDKEIELVPPPPCYKPAVEFYRVRTDETQKIALQFCDGRTNPDGVEALSRLSSPVGMEMPFLLHPKLIDMMQEVADAFPGKRLEIISGQRVAKSKGNESYHNKGQAMDFRVAGVTTKKLVSELRKFKNAGVGYYPNSVFVHLDTRERSAYWIDYSAPGEKAIYGRADMTAAEIEAIRAERRAEAAAREREDKAHFSQQLKAEIELAMQPEPAAAPTRRTRKKDSDESAAPLETSSAVPAPAERTSHTPAPAERTSHTPET